MQPALSSIQEADHNLLLCVMEEGISDTLSACLLKAHMERHFHISALKGGAIKNNPIASSQVDSLAKLCWQNEPIKLIDGGDHPHKQTIFSRIAEKYRRGLTCCDLLIRLEK